MKGRASVTALLFSACATAPPPVVDAPVTRATTVQRWSRIDAPGPLPSVPRVEAQSTRFTLPNGMQLIVVECHRRPVVSIELLLPSGAAADPPSRAGATYFAMALLGDTFDEKTELGTPRNPEEKSARRQVSDLGGSLLFGVTEDQAWIGIHGFARDTAKYLERLQEVVVERRHGEDAFGARMNMVSAALNELEVSDSVVVVENVTRLAFGAGHPYARPIYGTPESISDLTLDDASGRQEELLTPAGATLLVVGDVSPQKTFAMASKAFAKWKAAGPRAAVNIPVPPASPRKAVTFLPRSPATATLVCAGRPLTGVDASTAAVAVLTRVLGLRLSSVLREQHQLTYGAVAAIARHRRGQAMVACSRLEAAQTTAALQHFVSAMKEMAPVSPAELERARAGLIAEVESERDDVPGIVAAWRAALALGEKPAPEARVAELKAVTAEEVQRLGAKVLEPRLMQWMVSGEPQWVQPAVRAAALGPAKVPKLSKVLSDDGSVEAGD